MLILDDFYLCDLTGGLLQSEDCWKGRSLSRGESRKDDPYPTDAGLELAWMTMLKDKYRGGVGLAVASLFGDTWI